MKIEFLKFAAKSTYIFLLVVLTTFVGSLSFYSFVVEPANTNTLDETFTVEGKSERKVDPDSASITIGSYMEGKDVADLQKKTAERINKVTEEIKALGIPEDQIQTSNYSVNPVTNYNTNKIETHYIRADVTITVLNTSAKDERISQIISAASKNELNEVKNLYFYIDNEDAILDELELEAIENAKSSAKTKADAIGIKLGKIKNINRDTYTPYYYGRGLDDSALNVSAEAESSKISINPGQVDLSANVTLIYEIK